MHFLVIIRVLSLISVMLESKIDPDRWLSACSHAFAAHFNTWGQQKSSDRLQLQAQMGGTGSAPKPSEIIWASTSYWFPSKTVSWICLQLSSFSFKREYCLTLFAQVKHSVWSKIIFCYAMQLHSLIRICHHNHIINLSDNCRNILWSLEHDVFCETFASILKKIQSKLLLNYFCI